MLCCAVLRRTAKAVQQRPAQPAPWDMAGLDKHNLMRLSYMTEDQLLRRVKQIKRRDKLVSFIAVRTSPFAPCLESWPMSVSPCPS